MDYVKPEGKLGILIPGMGAVASTFIAGIEASAGVGSELALLTIFGGLRSFF